MFNLYLISILFCLSFCLAASWYDFKPYKLTVEDVVVSLGFSFVPAINIGVGIIALIIVYRELKDVVLFGDKK